MATGRTPWIGVCATLSFSMSVDQRPGSLAGTIPTGSNIRPKISVVAPLLLFSGLETWDVQVITKLPSESIATAGP